MTKALAWTRHASLITDIARVLWGVNTPRYSLTLSWHKRNDSAWLVQAFPEAVFRPPLAPRFLKIETRAILTQKLGEKPLWDGYGQIEALRDSDTVRSSPAFGCLYSWLASRRHADIVVEFGSAFGISGMYWLSGLEYVKHGHLLTFDPNSEWSAVARQNLAAIGTRFTQVNGTFEENIDKHLSGNIDIAFIDAIHTSEFVMPQFDLVRERSASHGLIVFDDINFSDDMMACWNELARRPEVASSVEVGGHVGIIELN